MYTLRISSWLAGGWHQPVLARAFLLFFMVMLLLKLHAAPDAPLDRSSWRLVIWATCGWSVYSTTGENSALPAGLERESPWKSISLLCKRHILDWRNICIPCIPLKKNMLDKEPIVSSPTRFVEWHEPSRNCYSPAVGIKGIHRTHIIALVLQFGWGAPNEDNELSQTIMKAPHDHHYL